MSNINGGTVGEILRIYGLGTLTAPPERVFGGLLHEVYRFHTTRGTFAVKRLNATVMQYTNVRAKFRLSERIAADIAAAGIPAVTAFPAVNGAATDVLQDIGGDTILVYPWLNVAAITDPNRVPSPVSAGPHRARRIGSILARIHSLPLQYAELDAPPDPSEKSNSTTSSLALDSKAIEAEEWADLAEQAERMNVPNSQEVRSLLPQIVEWNVLSRQAQQSLLTISGSRRAWVISHCDLDQKNVVWEDERTPYIIDWESAGYVQPAIETVGTALDWSGQNVGDLDTTVFDAFLEAYLAEGSLLTSQEIYNGLQAYCGNWCGWLKYNLQRAVGKVTSDAEEQELGKREMLKTLILLRSAANTIPSLARRFAST